MNLPNRDLKHGPADHFIMKEAIILAGGFGTRLRHILPDIPKSMAPVGDRPFLAYILEYLDNSGVGKVVIAAGYRHESIRSGFGSKYKNIKLLYSVEETPLGTGGAILKASSMIDSERCLVMNGDTYFNVDIGDFEKHHAAYDPGLSVALKPMRNFERYGSVAVAGGHITAFNEKRFCSEGYINGGVYILNKAWLAETGPGEVFSFERDVMEKRVAEDKITGYISDTYFIDIGIPEDYYRAGEELPLLFKG